MKTVLMTRRTVMLPAAAEDLHSLSSLWNQAAVRELLFDGCAVGAAQARRLLDAGLADADSGLGWWLAFPWNNGPAWGCVGLLRSPVAAQALGSPGPAVELVFAFGAEAWAEAYAQEVLQELVSHAVHKLRLPRLCVLGAVSDPLVDGLLRAMGFEAGLPVQLGHRSLQVHVLNAGAAPRDQVALLQDLPYPVMAQWPA